MTVHVVLSYDLGLKGDYRGLYKLLDQFSAVECGNSVAAFAIETPTDDFASVYEAIKNILVENVTIDPTDRYYLILQDSLDNKMKGKFIFGSRRRALWEGYHVNQPQGEDIF